MHSTAVERLNQLTPAEREVIRQCVHAAAHGPFFDDWEFQILHGVTRAEMVQVLENWESNASDPEALDLAVNNAMGNLLYYPHHLFDRWGAFIEATPEDVKHLFGKWRSRGGG